MMDNQVLECSAHTLEVNAPMVVEALIFGVDEKSVKHGVYFFVAHWGSVFLVVFAYEFAVGTIDVGCVVGAWLHDVVKRWRLAEEPQEIDVDGYECENDSDKQCAYRQKAFYIPGLAFIEALVPCIEAFVMFCNPLQHTNQFVPNSFHCSVVYIFI